MSETVGYKGKLKLCKKYKDADEIYNVDSTVDKSEIEIIKAEDVL